MIRKTPEHKKETRKTKVEAEVKTEVKKQKPRVKKPAVQVQGASSFGLHNLIVPHGGHKRKKILGRGSGSGHGKTSTRGSKGQTSRSGRDFYLGFEGGQTPLIRRMPKRGFTSRFRKEYQIVNIDDLSRIKEATITLDILEQSGLIKDKNKLVKILGDGEIKNAVKIQAHAASCKAAEKIKSAGGEIEIIDAERAG